MSYSRLFLAAALSLCSLSAVAATPTPYQSGFVPAVLNAQNAAHVQPVCRGCGCRGGAGYRLPNGKCASRR